ncbi:Uncharacterised protein [BD1-7 clade bacterium]|uniref:Uncharacterized protein n=1 Tax=BD1-7 clade bacterium TaxID=2029982 RepID=A0A5S9R1K3_9GAMM|nr:Uncharacterised protein [BD1-7 clade bacterium]
MVRTFQNIQDGELGETIELLSLERIGYSSSMTWESLLQSKRVLLISEAGTGKTHECREQAKRLWEAGEPSFFLELSTLASTDLRSMLDCDEENRLDVWLSSQSEVATFFLDSIDELKLSAGSFKLALNQLKKTIRDQLSRVRIIVTTRPITFDQRLIRSLLPVPLSPQKNLNGETFATIAMNGNNSSNAANTVEKQPADWLTVALMPLSDPQILEFASGQGVDNPNVLLGDIQRRTQAFARRPQDLIELCSDWRTHRRIRTHSDQVTTNVRVKIKPREDRPEPAELSIDKAIEGASRLSLAMLMTRRLTIRHSAEFDDTEGDEALDPAIILSDWTQNERKALLERSLFGFASYGRVRFHHRSVVEYLAAQRLQELRKKGMPFRALKRLLFAETQGRLIVRPSKRAIAAWLALTEDGVFELLRDSEPAVLFNEGDPESLTPMQRTQTLRAYVERFGKGGWRGLRVPNIQIHRFATHELAGEVLQLWNQDIENPDIRQTLLCLVQAGRMRQCADIVYETAIDSDTSTDERVLALDALVALEDPRLGIITNAMVIQNDCWGEGIAREAILSMFPHNLSIEQLCKILGWLKEEKKNKVGSLTWQLPRIIENADLDSQSLVALREGLVELVSTGLRWSDGWPEVVSDRSCFANALAVVCVRGLCVNKDDDWLRASILAMRLFKRENSSNDGYKTLRESLQKLTAEESARFIFAEDAFMQSLNHLTDPWRRFQRLVSHGGCVELQAERDLPWVSEALNDTERSVDDRAMLLEGAIYLASNSENWRAHVEGLKKLVTDQPNLCAVIDERLKPQKGSDELKRWEKEHAEKKAQEEAKDKTNRDGWIQFWREVSEHPGKAFSPENTRSTVWDLWRVMSRDGENCRESGWNRLFIEGYFDKETADCLRHELMKMWRQEHPVPISQRPEAERNTSLVRWNLGITAIYAEAEDSTWATKLTEDEARLAVKFALVKLGGLPVWIEDLVTAHRRSVEKVLGEELSWELEGDASMHNYSMLLQNIGREPESVVTALLPRFRAWLEANNGKASQTNSHKGDAERLRQVLDVLLKHGSEDIHTYLLAVAHENLEGNLSSSLVVTWLTVIMQLDPSSGVDILEKHVCVLEPKAENEAVILLGKLFNNRSGAVNLANSLFTPKLLVRLCRLAYFHIRPEDDIEHEGVYSPDVRDNAQTVRNEIVNVLLNLRGEDGWAAKLEMANDPVWAHFRDRALVIAEEQWAQEIDSAVLDDEQAIALDKTGEAPVLTNEMMFTLLKDRLADLDDFLLRDNSPWEAWARIDSERVMRREIARVLGDTANGLYTVDQEAVTADEKETDIRLRSVVSDLQAVIELKLGNRSRYTVRYLYDTIKNQLVKKYMAAENSRSGCLLITLAEDRQWQHPESKKFIGLDELTLLLREEAVRVEQAMGGAVSLVVHVLDLRPRLPKEKGR